MQNTPIFLIVFSINKIRICQNIFIDLLIFTTDLFQDPSDFPGHSGECISHLTRDHLNSFPHYGLCQNNSKQYCFLTDQ